MESRITPANRPGYCSTGTKISVLANFFKFTPKSSDSTLYRFSLSLSPEVSSSLSKQRERIILKAKGKLMENLGKFVLANTLIFSSQSSPEFLVTSEFDNISYEIKVSPAGHLSSSREIIHFYNKFFNSIQGFLKLIMIGRKFYNPERPINLASHKLTIWPGYSNSIGFYEEGCLLNIDISHRVLRTNTVFDQITEIKKSNPQDFKTLASRALVGSIVMTLYNKKCYKIDEIDWDMSPLNTFSHRDQNKEEVNESFKSYYSKRWVKHVCNDDQPLLKSKLKTMDCYLLPEFCVSTGLTDELRSDFSVMKDLTNATKKEPKDRLNESAALVKALEEHPKCLEEIKKWQISIQDSPVSLTAHVVPSGDVQMGENQKFKINEQSGNFDRDIQRAMFSQPRLDKWGVFFCERDRKLVEQNLMSNLVQVIKAFSFNCEKPAMFSVSSENWNDWDRTLRNSLNPSVRVIICVLPGNKGKCRLYDDLKRLTFSSFPVPSQVILNSTLRKDKGLRSVINKVIIQINAKVGGIPWVVSNLPFTQKGPCMVIGIDIFSKKSSSGVLGFCASTDKNFSRYASFPKILNSPSDLIAGLKSSTEESLSQFKSDNKVFPSTIIIFRDGISDSQGKTVLLEEIPAFNSAFESFMQKTEKFEMPSLIYVLVNKRTNARFYMKNNGNITNPPLGTVVDSKVVDKNGFDFYVTPAKANQGSMTPTYFNVIFDSSGLPCDQIQMLAYRLCYAYYNWSGSIRVPAPCQYAKKLAYMYGERSDRNGPPRPHDAWAGSRSLYFL